MAETKIAHISDTALWIAGYRALETERPDAAFKDVLAKKLAGQRGLEMVHSAPNTTSMAFAMIVRTTAIDRLVEKAVSYGIDTVINLGAGLDTRPYRMNLPAKLKWIEVDFEHVIKYKEELLASEKPVCDLKRIASDLSDDNRQKKLFADLGKETQKALIITEGVIGYLTNAQAAQLSKNIFSAPNFYYWIQDYNQGKLRKQGTKTLDKYLKMSPLLFNVKEPITFFAEHGWKVKDNIFILDEADRIGRKLPLMFPFNVLMFLFPKKIRALGNKTYGYVMFEKQ